MNSGLDENSFLLLHKHRLFQQLSRKEIESLKVDVQFKVAKKDEFIYFPQEWVDKLFFLKKGYIKIATIDNEGNEQIREVITQGDIFGQLTLEPKNAQNEFAQAIRMEACLCSFTVDNFQALLASRPQLSLSYVKWVGLRMQKMENRFANMLHKDVMSRLAGFLTQMAENYIEKSVAAELMMPVFLTHDEIGRLIGATRQTVTSKMAQLERDGVLSYTPRLITIRDLPRLFAIAKGE